MMPTQQQPSLDAPAEVQPPLVENVVETARRIGDTRSGILLPTVISFVLSTAAGALVAFLFTRAFGAKPRAFGGITSKTLSQIGVILPILVAFVLGLLFPGLFARRKRVLCMLLTIILQFVTLAVLVIVGLSQLTLPQLAALHLS